MPTIHRYDLKNKWANETHIGLAPAYTDADTWEKVQLSDESESAEGAEAAQANSE
jgi:hypothetical protein